MKRYIIATTDYDRDLVSKLESEMIDELQSIGVTDSTLKEMDVYAKPAGSGFRLSIRFPKRVFRGKTISEFFYRRDASRIVSKILGWYGDEFRDLVDRQDELLKSPKKRSSSSTFAKEARNTTDPVRLRQLAEHNAATVRRAVATNPNTPGDVLLSLYEDTDDRTRYNALRTMPLSNVDPNTAYSLYPDSCRIAEDVVAPSPDTDPSILAELFDKYKNGEDYNALYILRDVASNPSTPVETLTQLYALQRVGIDTSLAANPNLPDNIASDLQLRCQSGEFVDDYGNDYIGYSILNNLAKYHGR